ncbi:hypothetical protein X735_14105 [Mesorhizobium sp. L2C085B000]|nr:hypothetical protein X735_14105 [Mesorhizobium sp. L2C085B000]
MNSSRLRSAIEAPKLAITTMMACPCERSRENSTLSSNSASRAVKVMPTTSATSSGQPKDSGPMGATLPNIAPMALTTASVA